MQLDVLTHLPQELLNIVKKENSQACTLDKPGIMGMMIVIHHTYSKNFLKTQNILELVLEKKSGM